MRKSPTEFRSSGGTGRKSLECCSSENERERDQGEGVQNSGKTGQRHMCVEESTRKEIGGRRNQNATMDVRSYEAGQDKK